MSSSSSAKVAIIHRPLLRLVIVPSASSSSLLKTSEWEVKKLLTDLLPPPSSSSSSSSSSQKEAVPLMYDIDISGRRVKVEVVCDEEKTRNDLLSVLSRRSCHSLGGRSVVMTVEKREEKKEVEWREDEVNWRNTRSVWLCDLPSRLLGLNISSQDSCVLTPSHPVWCLLQDLTTRTVSPSSGLVSSDIERIEIVPRQRERSSTSSVVSSLLTDICVKFHSFSTCEQVAFCLGFRPTSELSVECGNRDVVSLVQNTETKKTFRFTVAADIHDDYLGKKKCYKREEEGRALASLREELVESVRIFDVDIHKAMLQSAQSRFDVVTSCTSDDHDGHDNEERWHRRKTDLMSQTKELSDDLEELTDAVTAVSLRLMAVYTSSSLSPPQHKTETQIFHLLPLPSSLSAGQLTNILSYLTTSTRDVRRIFDNFCRRIDKFEHLIQHEKESMALHTKVEIILVKSSSAQKIFSESTVECEKAQSSCSTLAGCFDFESSFSPLDCLNSIMEVKLQATRTQLMLLKKLLVKQHRVEMKLEETGRDDMQLGLEEWKTQVGHADRNVQALETCCLMLKKERSKHQLDTFFDVVEKLPLLMKQLSGCFDLMAITTASVDGVVDTITELKKSFKFAISRDVFGVFKRIQETLSSPEGNRSCAELDVLRIKMHAISCFSECFCCRVVVAEEMMRRMKKVMKDCDVCGSGEGETLYGAGMPEDIITGLNNVEYRLARLVGLLSHQLVPALSVDIAACVVGSDLLSEITQVLTSSCDTYVQISCGIVGDLESLEENLSSYLMSIEDNLSVAVRAVEKEKLLKEERKLYLLQKIERMKNEKKRLIAEEKREAKKKKSQRLCENKRTSRSSGLIIKSKRSHGDMSGRDSDESENVARRCKAFNIKEAITRDIIPSYNVKSPNLQRNSSDRNKTAEENSTDKECDLREMLLRKKLLSKMQT